MKLFCKLPVRIVAAVAIGLLLAGAGTKITYGCAPIDGAVGCVSFEKAIMHPGDLLGNKQDSLVHFSVAFVVAALVSFVALSIVDVAQKRPKQKT